MCPSLYNRDRLVLEWSPTVAALPASPRPPAVPARGACEALISTPFTLAQRESIGLTRSERGNDRKRTDTLCVRTPARSRTSRHPVGHPTRRGNGGCQRVAAQRGPAAPPPRHYPER